MTKKYTQPAQAIVGDSIAEATEAQEGAKIDTRKTSKEGRINLALIPENLDYLRTMARVTGVSTTDFINKIVEQHMEANAELYEKAKAFRAALDQFKF